MQSLVHFLGVRLRPLGSLNPHTNAALLGKSPKSFMLPQGAQQSVRSGAVQGSGALASASLEKKQSFRAWSRSKLWGPRPLWGFPHSWSQNGTRENIAVDDLLHHFEWTCQQSLFKELQANNKRKHFWVSLFTCKNVFNSQSPMRWVVVLFPLSRWVNEASRGKGFAHGYTDQKEQHLCSNLDILKLQRFLFTTNFFPTAIVEEILKYCRVL